MRPHIHTPHTRAHTHIHSLLLQPFTWRRSKTTRVLSSFCSTLERSTPRTPRGGPRFSSPVARATPRYARWWWWWWWWVVVCVCVCVRGAKDSAAQIVETNSHVSHSHARLSLTGQSARELLHHGVGGSEHRPADPDAADDKLRTPLHVAAKKNHVRGFFFSLVCLGCLICFGWAICFVGRPVSRSLTPPPPPPLLFGRRR